MPRATRRLTKTRLPKLRVGRIHFCIDPRGFGVRIRENGGRRTYTYVVKRDVGGRCRTLTYKHKGKEELENARRWAKPLVRMMEEGQDPTIKTVEDATCTLRLALEMHVLDMENKGCTQRSIDSLRERIKRLDEHAQGMMDRDMSTITRLELRALHAKLTQKVERVKDGKVQTVGGKYAANNTLRHVQMLFNTPGSSTRPWTLRSPQPFLTTGRNPAGSLSSGPTCRTDGRRSRPSRTPCGATCSCSSCSPGSGRPTPRP